MGTQAGPAWVTVASGLRVQGLLGPRAKGEAGASQSLVLCILAQRISGGCLGSGSCLSGK